MSAFGPDCIECGRRAIPDLPHCFDCVERLARESAGGAAWDKTAGPVTMQARSGGAYPDRWVWEVRGCGRTVGGGAPNRAEAIKAATECAVDWLEALIREVRAE